MADFFNGGLPLGFLFVFVRISGMLLLNPLLSRKNVPQTFKMGFIVILSIIISPTVDSSYILSLSSMDKVVALMKELILGAVTSTVFNLFYFSLVFTGDFIDMQLGLSMAKAFDPGTSIQISLTGKLLTLLFVFYFFASDAHLLLIKMFAESFKFIPPGCCDLSFGFVPYLLNLFISIFALSFKLALPFVIAEFTIEVALGILMRVIPQIHVFVISMQMRILVGLILMIAYAPAVSSFMDKYLNLFMENTYAAMRTAAF